MTKPTIICVLPVKNEAWILNNFIEHAGRWADIIILGDNGSSDGSLVNLPASDKFRLISVGSEFNEYRRRRLLLDEARKIPGKRLIFCIDADEMLSANWEESPDWEIMLNAAPGTKFYFDWVAVLPGLTHYMIEYEMLVAFIDDGTEYHGTEIHSLRIPDTSGDAVKLSDIKLLHYAYIDPERMFSRHRWYKCYELMHAINRPWRICIIYQGAQIKCYGKPILPMLNWWITGYKWLEKYRFVQDVIKEYYWFDVEILDFFDTYGVDKFRKLNIWDVDWNKKARLLGRKGDYRDPRFWFEQAVHIFIEKYRGELEFKQSLEWKAVRFFAKMVLRPLGW